ncbi:hypothetical protein [Xanthomonas graminis]|uniref:hypothetical protein n=1 Tax=Xanthomonas graminis TaxID=3390026 RepID=UPI001C400EB9|nr:hypothetical protein [Xanthomonas translucens]
MNYPFKQAPISSAAQAAGRVPDDSAFALPWLESADGRARVPVEHAGEWRATIRR